MPSTNGHGPKRAILYARVSTDEQARSGYSLRQQLERLRKYAAEEGYEVLEEVTDAGYSGTSLQRPGMDRVRDLVQESDVCVVLAQDRDRFAREPAYVYLLREEFAEYGCKLRSLNDRGDDSPEGELTDGILDQHAKFERAKMMERTRRGKQRKAQEGRISTNRAAFGFDYNATRDGYVINPAQIEVVRRIFYMAGVEKTTIYAIKQDLERRDLITPSGKSDWDPSFIRGLLLNDLYKPHTFEAIRRIVSLEVAARLDPEARYGVWWSGRRAMSARTFSRPESGRIYLYYVCMAGAHTKRGTCSARTHHKAEEVEARVWDVVSGILKDPERLRAGLDYMIEQERRGVHGDPTTETERWLEEISEAGRKRARYQEMAAEGLMDFEELPTRLAALEDTRNTAEQELRALQRRTEHLAQLERDRDSLLESYADLMPEAIDALGPDERRRVYKIIGLEAHLASDGSFELSGDVMSFSKLGISSS